MKKLFLTLLLAFLPLCAAAQPSSVAVNDLGGTLSPTEKTLLARLDSAGVPVPDSIVIVADTTDGLHGWHRPLRAPNTLHLANERFTHPNVDTTERFPYLFGRKHVPPSDVPPHVHVLAHEWAHMLGPRLNVRMGRPAFGRLSSTQEVQAEILGLVLGRIAFNYDHRDLGFPSKIQYPFDKDKLTERLRWQYCLMTQNTWDVEMNCTRAYKNE